MTNIRRPGDYTNTFSKAENATMQKLLEKCARELAEHAHADIDKIKFRVAEHLPRQAVRDRLVKMVERKGWDLGIERDVHKGGLLLTLWPAGMADDTPDEVDQQLDLIPPTAAGNRDWNC
jgi:hypothetical protein